MRFVLPLACALALSAGAAARPAVIYTGTGGSVDLHAEDFTGVADLLLIAPPGPTPFGIGGGIATPGVGPIGSGMAGDSTVTLAPLSMSMVGAILGGSTAGGGLSGVSTADIFFTLAVDVFGTFAAGFTLFDPNPLLAGEIILTGPDAASVALGAHVFHAGDYHLHGEVSMIGIDPIGDSGHLDFGASISFVPTPLAAGIGGLGLLTLAGARRRR